MSVEHVETRRQTLGSQNREPRKVKWVEVELTRVLKIMSDGISQACTLQMMKSQYKLFALKDSLSQNIPSILVFLPDPGAHT